MSNLTNGRRSRRTVALLTTGGTIASVAAPDGDGSAAGLSPQMLLDQAGSLGDVHVEPVLELARVNSSDVGPDLMWSIASRVEELARRPEVGGVVVTHGTDTIEETAFVADIVTSTEKPVVFVGSMRSADEPSADGPRNLRTAVLAASSAAMAGLGVTVCLDDELHAARWVRKIHSHRVGALASPGHGPVAAAVPGGGLARLAGADMRRWSVDWPTAGAADEDVPLVAAFPGIGPELVRAVVAFTGARGLVLEGFGAGHVPASIADVVSDLLDDGVVVVIATRVLGGGTWSLYGGAGKGVALRRAGVLAAGRLSAGKARLLLMACLAGAADPATTRARFERAIQALDPQQPPG